MKKKKSNMAAGVTIGMATGMAIGALGATQIPAVKNSKFMKQAKKSIQKGAKSAMNTIDDISQSLPHIFQ